MCAIEIKSSVAARDAVVFAHNAIMMGVDLIITSNETGEILFHYENGAVKWIEKEFAREMLIA